MLGAAKVTAILKDAISPDGENYRPLSITPILSKVYEKLVSHKLSSFCEKYVFLPVAQFAYRKALGCTDALCTISYHLQKSLDSAAFDGVSKWSLIQIEIFWCRWQCVVHLWRVPI